MQKFTRALTREIEVGGERFAVTLSAEGLAVRTVGSRKPPHNMTWAACLAACVAGGKEPGTDELADLVKQLKAGAKQPSADGRSAGAKEDHSLAALLAQVDHWLAEHRGRFHKALLPGASGDELAPLEHLVGGPLPTDLKTWLGWHDGQNADVVGAFEQSWNLMSGREIVEAKKKLDAERPDGWHANWLPILDDDGGDYVVVELDQPSLPVREFWRGKSDHPVVAASLAAWVGEFLNGLQAGKYHEDPERGTFSRS